MPYAVVLQSSGVGLHAPSQPFAADLFTGSGSPALPALPALPAVHAHTRC